MILTDNEADVDLLNYTVIATTIDEVVTATRQEPLTIGIHGGWGAGKSSVLSMVESQLANRDRICCLRFNGWQFQGFEDAKIVLMQYIVRELLDRRPASDKLQAAATGVLKRINWLKLARLGAGFASTATTGIPLFGLPPTGNTATDSEDQEGSKGGSPDSNQSWSNRVRHLLDPAESGDVPQEIHGFRREFDELIEAAEIDRLVILLDDLDRCLPDQAVETLEAVRLFLFTKRTAFVIAADEAMIEYAVRRHFPDLPATSGPHDYSRDYLEKLIQVPFRLPTLGLAETKTYVSLLLIRRALGDTYSEFDQIVALAHEKLVRPWFEEPLTYEAIRERIGSVPQEVETALSLSAQLAPSLAEGTHGNPRQIKRFINTIFLRERSADARGFGEDIDIPVLAKLMLAEHFLPKFFEEVVKDVHRAPNGKSPLVNQLEREATGADITSTSETPETISNDLQGDPHIQHWLAVRPPLADIDLRPYLFASRDSERGARVPGRHAHLSPLLERLRSGRLGAQMAESEVRALNAEDRKFLVNVLIEDCNATTDWSRVPESLYGVTAVVKTDGSLEPRLLDFLERLPVSELGPQFAAGWQEVIGSQEGVQRLQRILRSWNEQTGNQTLQIAARQALERTGA